MRRGGRGDTPAEEALFIARDWGIRSDAWEMAWERNKGRADELSAEEWFDEIRAQAVKLDRASVPRPESVVVQKDLQAKVRRQKEKLRRKKDPPPSASSANLSTTPAIPPPRHVVGGRKG